MKNWRRMPTDAEFSTMKVVIGVLKPPSLTDALSGEKQVTVSAVLPVMKHVKSKLSPVSSDCRLAKEMKQVIWNDLETRYTDPEVSDILDISSFLDPRFKDQHLQNKEETVSSITQECTDHYENESTHDRSRESTVRLSTEPEDSAVNNPPPAERLKGLAAVLKHIEQEESDTAHSSDTHLHKGLRRKYLLTLSFQQSNQMQILLPGGRGSKVDFLTWPTWQKKTFVYVGQVSSLKES